MIIKEVAEATTAEQARQYAIDWQSWQSEQSLSYGELAKWQGVFNPLAGKFGLEEEFKENGVL